MSTDPRTRFSSNSSITTTNSDDFDASTIQEDEDDDDLDVDVFLDKDSDSALPHRSDVLGLGQTVADFSGVVNDEFLMRLGLDKGARKVVNHVERDVVLQAMDGCSYKVTAGRSLSNSLMALARLGGHPMGGPALNVAMVCSIGSNPLGGFYM